MLRPYQRYPEGLKLQVCESILSGSMTVSEAAEHYAIRNLGSIYSWINSLEASTDPVTMSKEKQEDPEVLKARIKALEKQLEHEKLRSFALDAMIDIAERELKVPIRKKSSTKQSGT